MTDLIIETGKVQTRDGTEVRIYATDASGDYPVHGARRRGYGWEPETWTLKGAYTLSVIENARDLVPVPQAQYFNVYTSIDGACYIGKMCEGVDNSVQLGTMTIEMEDGETFETFRYCNGEITKVEPEGYE
jgi:hypothetical protein